MITANELQKNFGEIHAVRGISFEVGRGEVVGLLGPNGAGKTTTMRLLTTYLSPTAGTASIGGFDILREAEEVRRRIGYLPETPPLYPEMRVRDYLGFVCSLKGVSRTNRNGCVDEAIEHCGLNAVSQRRCGSLSRGFRQRVGLAQALVHHPEVVILDEPTNGLDPSQIVEVRRLIHDLAQKRTVMLSTHVLQEVVETCSRVVIIASGRVVVSGALAELTRETTLEKMFLDAIAEAGA